MHGRISEPTMGPYPPRVALALCTGANQPAISQRGQGLHAARGGVDPGEHRFRSQGVGIVEIRRDYDPGMGSYPLRVALALRAPANQRSANGIGVSTSFGAVPTRGTPVFIPGMSEW